MVIFMVKFTTFIKKNILIGIIKKKCFFFHFQTIAKTIYWLTFANPGDGSATMQSAGYDGSNIDTSFLTITTAHYLLMSDMVLYDGFFYVASVSFEGSDLSSDVLKVPETKGGVAVAIELTVDLSYLFIEPGIIGRYIKQDCLMFRDNVTRI